MAFRRSSDSTAATRRGPSGPAAALLAAALLGALPAQAGSAGEPPRRTAAVGRVARAQAPRIDGHLTDDCWRDAPAIGELVMVEPWEGRAPTHPTVVKLLHDEDNLYVALWCYDSEPAAICCTQRARDARLDPDDRVEILLDPFENRRTAYFFQIGAGGSIGDILIGDNGAKFDKPWDAVWRGESRVTDDGWYAELAIPFRSIPRRDGAASWGFNLRRLVRRSNEAYQWANPVQAVPFFRISECGTITGFGPIDSGLGVDLVPYAKASVARNRTAADDDWGDAWDAGGELYYRLLPSLTLAATLRTDFAETENDGRQINLNRFPLFFPEKRDFFLEGTSFFSFGATSAGDAQFLPFFSRRVGLSRQGAPIPLLGGVKVTGQAGPLEIGVLDVVADATGTTDEENLAVARFKYALAPQTTVGVIGTHGNPASTGGRRLGGVDFYHRIPQFLGDMDLQATLDVAATEGSGTGSDGESFGADLRSRGREWDVELGTRWISGGFDPALGFVRRRDTRASVFEIGYKPRFAEGSAVRNGNTRLQLRRSEEWDHAPQDTRLSIERLGVELHTGDGFYLFGRREFERIDREFALFRGSTTVFAGDYWTTRGGLEVQTTEGRPWNATLIADTGGFYDGRSDNLQLDGEWRTSALLHLGGGYQTTAVDLGPGRAFTTQIASLRVDLHFTPDVSLRNLVQFDNESNVLGWQSRLRWIYAAGCDFFAVLGTSWLREEDGTILPTEQALQLKVAHTLRF